jgi:hypothetical protein
MEVGAEQRVHLRGPVVERSERGARALADAYWDEIRVLTLGLVRARRTPEGVELALLRRVSLLRFGEEQTSAGRERVECRFRITGGLLAGRPGGSLTLRQEVAERPELAVIVEGYVPRLDSGRERGGLRTMAYHGVQARIHGLIGRRYLERMAREAR